MRKGLHPELQEMVKMEKKMKQKKNETKTKPQEAAKPLKQPLEKKGVAAEGKMSMRTAAPANAAKNVVLLVEDNKLIAGALAQVLKTVGGFEVVTVDNLEDAEKKLAELDGQLAGLVTDMFFPKKNGETEVELCGLNLVKKVKKTMPGLAIIAQSSSPVALEAAKKLGADTVLDKNGLKIADLLTALSKPEDVQDQE